VSDGILVSDNVFSSKSPLLTGDNTAAMH